MTKNGFRICALQGVLMILAGMVLAGFPLAFLVMEDVYGQNAPIAVGGDYRGWIMAHLEGLLNGLLVIALSGVTLIRSPMQHGRQAWLVPSILIAGWGNTFAAILAPALSVRGMAANADIANNIVWGIFTIALIASFTAFYGVISHLATKQVNEV
ncbi:hypothetical protein [Ponticaulis profundi]|uniref:Uncharacterized protein n=1 Tax=Ponticaulis profundi TaxID=2665222 RepID=A0ABW1SEE0_9PROT